MLTNTALAVRDHICMKVKLIKLFLYYNDTLLADKLTTSYYLLDNITV